MRILLVTSGHEYSTFDVCQGVDAGLRANGAEVIRYPLEHTLAVSRALIEAAESLQVLEHYPDVHVLAAQGIPAVALNHWPIDVLLVVTGSNLPWTVPYAFRRTGVLTALLCTESPYLTEIRESHDAAVYDLVYTNERRALPLFTRNQPGTVQYLPHAYQPSVHWPGPAEPEKQADVFFVGTAFDERQALIRDVDWAGIQLLIRGSMWEGTASPEQMLAGVLDNADVAAYYRSAHICLNHHRTTAAWKDGTHIPAMAAESLGPRAYEIAACGGFQLCDDGRPELYEIFGDTVPTYRAADPADLERQIRYWLAHPHEREQHRLAQHAAIVPHTWTARAAVLLEQFVTTQQQRQQAA